MELNSIQNIKNYTVVQFVLDNTFSEIPTGFLKRTMCYNVGGRLEIQIVQF